MIAPLPTIDDLIALIPPQGATAAEIAAAVRRAPGTIGVILSPAVKDGRIIAKKQPRPMWIRVFFLAGTEPKRIPWRAAPAAPKAPPPEEPSWVRAERARVAAEAAELERVAALLARYPEISAADLARRLGHVGAAASKGGEPRPLPGTAVRRLEALEAAGRAVPLDPPSAGYARRWSLR